MNHAGEYKKSLQRLGSMKHSSEDISVIFKYPRRRKTAHVMNWKLLALLCSLFSCQATPIRRQVPSEKTQDEERLEREVNCALHMLTSKAFTETYSIQFPLGYKVLCKIHDQYTYMYKTNNLEFQSPIDDRDTSNLLLQSLRSTCQWVLLKDNTTLSGCSLPEIRQACAAYKLYEQTSELLDEFNDHVKGNKNSEEHATKFVKTESAKQHLCNSSIAVKAACKC